MCAEANFRHPGSTCRQPIRVTSRRNGVVFGCCVLLMACSSQKSDAPLAVNSAAVVVATAAPLPNLDSLAQTEQATGAGGSTHQSTTHHPGGSHSGGTAAHASTHTGGTAAHASSHTGGAAAHASSHTGGATSAAHTTAPAATTTTANGGASATASTSTHPPKRPGLLSPNLFASGGAKSVEADTSPRRRSINAPTRPGATTK